MKCTFFGHRNTASVIKPALTNCIEKLILQNNAKIFYVGTHGAFDRIVWEILCLLKEIYPHIICYKVLAYLPSNNIEAPESTIYPEGLEALPKKFAILKRNEWMVNTADTVIAYVRHPGGADTFTKMAKRKGKLVIEL